MSLVARVILKYRKISIKKGLRTALCFFLFIASSHSAFAKTSVFEVSKGKHSFCLAGSIHLLRKQDYPLPKPYTECFNSHSVVVFEVDLSGNKKRELSEKANALIQHSDGKTLKDDLSAPVFKRLDEFLNAQFGQSKRFQSLTPQGIYTVLSMLKFQLSGATETGVDDYLMTLAEKQNKKIEQLESIEFQVQLLASLGKGKENLVITGILDSWDEVEPELFFTWWRTGELEKLRAYMEESSSEFDALNQQLLVDRNKSWMPSIMEKTKENSDYFIVVGAAHLTGKQGLLALLTQQGYQIKQL